jgi:hypothetical protein
VNAEDYHLVAMGDVSPLSDGGIVFTLSFAIVFGLAGIARRGGWDRDVPVLRAVADLVPGASPLLVAAAALLAIPVEIAVKQTVAGEPPSPLAAAVFVLILGIGVAVRLLTRMGLSPRRLEAPVIGGLFILVSALVLAASPAIRASVFGIAIGSSALFIGVAIAYLYARGARTSR